MSKVNFKKYSIMILLAVLAVFAFGCKEEVRVKDIYFAHSEQIVLLVGEELTPSVVVTPSYADDTNFTISTSNASVVSVANNKIKAVSEGTATIKVVASDNSLLEDMITVNVKSQPSKLSTPTGLKYSHETQTISFDMINNASSYVLSVNGVEMNLGNSNSITLERINEIVGSAYDNLLNVKVKAKAPTYTKAFVDSDFSSVYEIYQVSAVENIQVKNGVLNFKEKNDGENTFVYDVYINNSRLTTVEESGVDFTILNSSYAGTNINVGVVAKVQGKSATNGYYASTRENIMVNVIDAPTINMNDTQVYWNAISKIGCYAIYLNDVEKIKLNTNHMKLSQLSDLDVEAEVDYKLSVVPVLDENSINVAKTVKKSEITFNKLATPTISLTESEIVWNENVNAGAYYITLKSGTETVIDNSILATSYSLANYPAGTYDFTVKASGKFVNGVFYIASDVATKTSIVKNSEVQAIIDNYNLEFEIIDDENYSIKIDDGLEQIKSSAELVDGFYLKDIQFESGAHEIVIKHLGNGTSSIDSEETTVSFIQLEKIEAIEVENSTAVLSAGKLNTDNNAEIKIIVRSAAGIEKIVGNGTSLKINQGDLDAGVYTVVAQVLGTGKSEHDKIATFSYMENGEVADCCSDSFVVLAAPELKLLDNSKTELSFNSIENCLRYELFRNNSETREGVVGKDATTVYAFTINEEETVEYKIVAKGDGAEYLDSNFSEPITIAKLSTPSLSFDNLNNIMIKQDNNDETNLSYSYILKHNNVEVPYDWATEFEGLVEGENKFTLQLITSMENYINSNESDALVVNAITKLSTLNVNTNNQLVVSPDKHTRKYNLILSFDFGGQVVEFKTVEDGKLVEVGGTREITYSYASDKYLINLLNVDYTPVLQEMSNNFSVKVAYFANAGENIAASGYCESITISPLEKTTLTRDGQNVVFENIVPLGNAIVRTYRDFALLINKSQVVSLNDLSISGDENAASFSVPMSYITARTTLSSSEPNTLQVITKNSYNETENEAISVVGETLNVVVEPSMMFSTSKDNKATDNSVIISFETYDTTYDKNYIVYVYNETIDDGKTFTFTDANDTDSDGIISIRLDDIDLIGMLKVQGVVSTSATHEIGETENKEIVYHFNSVASNALMFNKVETATDLHVENGILKFESKDAAKIYGYEIYDATTGEFIEFVTANSYNVQDVEKVDKVYEFKVKAIAKEGINATNSSMSDGIKVVKLATPTISTYYGDLSVGLSDISLALLSSETDSCELIIKNLTTHTEKAFKIDANSQLIDNNLIVSCFDILSYGSSSLNAEEIEVFLRVNLTDETREVQYINSDSLTKNVYGMFAPTNVEITTKTTETNEYPEYIKWLANALNSVNGASVEGGYQFKLTYKGEPYSSTDTKLVYLKDSVKETYGLAISSTQCLFPVSYHNLEFGAGIYSIAVRTVSSNVATADGSLVCGSHYSQEFMFEIMQTPQPTVENGVITWEEIEKAENYSVKVDAETSAVLTTENYFVYSKEAGGMFEVVVQAKDTKDNKVLNSETSEALKFFCLPNVEAGSIKIDDGRLYLTASDFFTTAKIQFVFAGNVVETIDYVNKNYEANIASLGVDAWGNLLDLTKLSKTSTYEIEIDEDKLKNLIGGSYSINIQLIGNTSDTLGIINSSVVENVDNLTLNQLTATDLYSVKNGVLTFALAGNYESGIYINNVWNDVEDEFIKNTPIFKIEVEASNVPYVIYAIDYQTFINAKSTLDESSYKIFETETEISAHGDLYGYYIYNSMFINIFKNNRINLRDYDFLKYYQITETKDEENNTYTWSGVSSVVDENGDLTITDINLGIGGTFVVRSTLLGGDLNATIAYLTSNTAESNLFVRYQENEITTNNGFVRFKDQTVKVLDEVNSTADNPVYITIDKPIYKLTITGNLYDADSTEVSKVFYLYQGGTLPERAEFVNNPGQFIEIEDDYIIDGYVYFDMRQYCEAGAYDINIRTFAGIGSESEETQNNPQDYLIDSKKTLTTFPIRQIKESEIFAKDGDGVVTGFLTFDRGYVLNGKIKEFCDTYEITIIDNGAEFVFNISSGSDGFKVNGETIQYKLPNKITNENGDELIINSSKIYEIKIRPMSSTSGVVNARYFKADSVDKTLKFKMSGELSDLRIEDGVLKWTSNGTENKFVLRLIYSTKDGKQYVLYDEPTVAAGTAQQYVLKDTSYPIEGVNTETAFVDFGNGYIVDLRGFNNVEDGGVVTLLSAVSTLTYEGSIIPLTRLEKVDSSTIESYNGKLRWVHVSGAVAYEVVVDEIYKYYVEVADDAAEYCELDLANTTYTLNNKQATNQQQILNAGNYTIKIRAIGDTNITAINSSASEIFEVLGKVDETTISFKNDDGKTLTWAKVDNADGYFVTVRYNYDGDYKNSVSKEVVGTNELDITTLEVDLNGKFEVEIRAIGVGVGNVLTGASAKYTSTTFAPQQVGEITVDETNFAFTWETQGEMFEGDKFVISYKFEGVETGSTVVDVNLEPDDYPYVVGQTNYSFKFTEIGKYSNFKVYVKRSGTASSLVKEYVKTYEFNKFASGDGTDTNPYIIMNAQHLKNIALSNFNTKHFIIANNISLSAQDIKENGIIASSFSGSINGLYNKTTYSIQFNDSVYNISNYENFALFGTLNQASISNLYIKGGIFENNGQESSTKFINSFAKQDASVLNLSLIAVDAVNATLNNVNVENIEFELEIENVLSHVYVAGVVANMQGGSIVNSAVKNFKISFANSNNTKENESAATTFIGGIAARALNGILIENSNVSNFAITQNTTILVAQYVGGAVGYLTYNDYNQRSTLTSVKVGWVDGETYSGIIATNLIATNFGGLVGLSEFVNISNCSTIVEYSAITHSYKTNIGGVVGASNNTSINSVVVNVKLGIENFVSTSVTQDQFVGAVGGDLRTNSSVENYTITAQILSENVETGELEYVNVSDVNGKTIIENIITILGVYGKKV